MSAKQITSRRYLLTINNPTNYNLSHSEIKNNLLQLKNVKYWCMSDEIGDEGTYHTHLFIWFNNSVACSTIKKLFEAAHIDVCKGTAQEVRDYVTKQGHDEKAHTKVEGTFEEMCDFEDSAGLTFEKAIQYIKDGTMSISDIIDENRKLAKSQVVFQQYKSLVDREKYSKCLRDVEVTYKCGAPGTGKSSSIYASITDWSDIYVVQDYVHPFDAYDGQSIIVFEEYRSNFMLTNMLQYLDRYPVQLPARYANRMAQFTKIYVVSNLTISEQYSQVDEASKQAFLRRFNSVEYYYDDHIEKFKICFNSGRYELDYNTRALLDNPYSTYSRNLKEKI